MIKLEDLTFTVRRKYSPRLKKTTVEGAERKLIPVLELDLSKRQTGLGFSLTLHKKYLTCLAWSFLTNPVAATILPAPSTVLWATAVTPVTTAPLTWDTPDTVFPATVGTKEEERKWIFEEGVGLYRATLPVGISVWKDALTWHRSHNTGFQSLSSDWGGSVIWVVLPFS